MNKKPQCFDSTSFWFLLLANRNSMLKRFKRQMSVVLITTTDQIICMKLYLFHLSKLQNDIYVRANHFFNVFFLIQYLNTMVLMKKLSDDKMIIKRNKKSVSNLLAPLVSESEMRFGIHCSQNFISSLRQSVPTPISCLLNFMQFLEAWVNTDHTGSPAEFGFLIRKKQKS